MNMSYCRFENTFSDFEDCLDNLFENIKDLSEDEKFYREELAIKAKEYVEQWEMAYGTI